MRTLRTFICLAALVVLTGCPGGDDDTLVNTTPTIDPTTPTVAVVASLEALTSNPQIPSDAQLPVTITALLKDANNNVVVGRAVTFAADSGVLSITQPVTDTSGRAIAELSAAGDPANRLITVTVSLEGETLTSTVGVQVVGTQLTITGPTSLVQGATATYTLVLSNAAGTGIAGEAVAVTSSLGNTLASTTLTTDFTGQAQVAYTAVNGGTDTFSAQALGEVANTNVSISSDDFSFVTPAENTEITLNTPQDLRVRWVQNNVPRAGQTVTFSTTRGTLTPSSVVTNANGEATVSIQAQNSGFATVSAVATGGPTTTRAVEFVATMPASIEVQADPFTVPPNSQSTITAILRDAAGNLVKNKSVSFNLMDITGGSLSVGSAVTDSQGRAQTFYTSSGITSAVDGVQIDVLVDENPTITDAINLTVAGREVFFTFGTGNSIFESNTAQYRKEFIVQVTDADGRAVTGVNVAMSVVSVKYVKGVYWANTADEVWSRLSRVRCDDEDVNRNGILDAGEDFNTSGSIEAGNIVTVIPGSFVSDVNGFGLIDLFYPQEQAGWLEVELQARTSVQGTEFSEKAFFILEGLADDFNDLDITPPARAVVVEDFVFADLIGTVPGLALGVSAGTPPNAVFGLLSSPWGYNNDCSVWEFGN